MVPRKGTSTPVETVMRVGVLSDTHGLLRDGVPAALAGVDMILHAGDVGSRDVLRELGRIAPVTVVRGNMDNQPWAHGLSGSEIVPVGPLWFYLVHDIFTMDIEPGAAGIDVVVSGHTHRASCTRRKGVLYLNPGSAGPLRGARPATLALMDVLGDEVKVRFLQLT